MKNIIVLITIFLCNIIYSQHYESLDTGTLKKRVLLKEQFEKKYSLFNENLKNTYRGKEYRTIFYKSEKFQESFKKEIIENNFVMNVKISNYIDSIFTTIKDKNPELKDKVLDILISKKAGANAATYFDGTIVINLDLLYYLDNEEQLASVMAHEIAHDLSKHGIRSIEENVQKELSKSFKDKTKEITKKKYGKYNKALEEIKDLLYSDSKVSKKRELEADSLGYTLFKKAGFTPPEFVGALRILKEIGDTEEELKEKQILDTIDYMRLFNLPELAFKDKWLIQEDFSDYNYEFYKEKINKDSIVSHPEIEKRIYKLKKDFKELNEKKYATKEASDSFKKLQEIAKYEQVPNLYHNERYGVSIYYILQMMKSNKNDEVFLKEWLGNNFNELYKAKKEYKYNRYVDQIKPQKQSKSYIQFLNFMWNLSLNDIATIAKHYKKSSN